MLEQQRTTLGERHPEREPTLRALSRLLAETGRAAEAEELLALADAIEREAQAGSSDAPR